MGVQMGFSSASLPVQTDRQRLPSYWMLLLILSVHLLCYFWAQPNMEGSDDLGYAQIANSIYNGTFALNPHPFTNRLALTVPTALFYDWFGVNAYTSTLWPLLCSLGLIATVYAVAYSLFGNTTALFSALLLALNPFQIYYSVILMADMVLAAFLFMSVATLYYGRTSDASPGRQRLFALLFVLSYTIAVMAKEPAIWNVLLIGIVLAIDLHGRRNQSFWQVAVPLGLLVGFGYFFIYFLVTGEFFYRFNGIERSQGIDVQNMQQLQQYYMNKPWIEILQRVTYKPILMILSVPGLMLGLLVALPAFVYALRPSTSLSPGVVLFVGYLFNFLGFFWFSSISWQHYNPMILQPNYLLPILAPLCLFGGVVVNRLYDPAHFGRPANRLPIIVMSAVVVLMVAVLQILGYYKYQAILFAAPILLMAVGNFSLGRERLQFTGIRQFLVVIFVVSLGAITVLSILRREVGLTLQQQAEQQIVNRYLSAQQEGSVSQPVRLFADHRSIKVLKYYLNFSNNRTIAWQEWEDVKLPLMAKSGYRTFVYVNSWRLAAMHGTYRYPIPAFIRQSSPDWKKISSQEGITLYEIINQTDSVGAAS